MPYGITSIAAFMQKNGHEVILANLSSYGYSEGVKLTINSDPDVVAISIFSFNRTESFKYIKELKKRKKNIIIVAGGQHPTFLSNQILLHYPEIDYIIKGEGESSFQNLIDNNFNISDKIITSSRIPNLNDIPFASSFSGESIGVNPNEQFKFIITSRGCPSSCTYCSSPFFWEKKVTYRTPENIVDELIYIQKKFGIIYFSIRDDNFTLNKKRVLKFCKLLNQSGIYMMWNCQARVDTIDEEMLVAMKRCGLEHIQFGVESGSKKILQIYDKHITLEKIQNAASITRKVGVYLSFYLMTGMTGESRGDLEKTKKLLTSSIPHDVIVSPVAYYPGTEIYTDSLNKGLINDSIWFNTEENGLYLSDQKENEKKINNILQHSAIVAQKSRYTEKDFKIHSQTSGEDCWINNIFEGDYYFEISKLKKASLYYDRLISEQPSNIWGYLRKAELLATDSPQQSLKLFQKASSIVPSYYGVWYRMAQIQYSMKMIPEASISIKKAIEHNPYEPEIKIFSHKILKIK